MSLVGELESREGLLDLAAVAKFFGRSREAVCDWVRDGKISAIRIGERGLFFDPKTLAAELAALTTKAGAK
jgi:hypothetical protein